MEVPCINKCTIGILYLWQYISKEGFIMTVISQVNQTMAGLKSAQASFETFSLQTENKQAKQLYQNAAQQTEMLINSLVPRIHEMEQEEPQYKQ
jgi:hypothetical protein